MDIYLLLLQPAAVGLDQRSIVDGGVSYANHGGHHRNGVDHGHMTQHWNPVNHGHGSHHRNTAEHGHGSHHGNGGHGNGG